MKRTFLLTLLLAGVLISFRSVQQPDTDRFTVPEGFVVEEVYSPEKAGSVVAMTFDSFGRIVLSREDSFVVTLYPAEDGSFVERVFTDQLTEAQGTVFDGLDLIAVADGPHGGPHGTAMYRVVDEDGDSRGDRVEVVEKAVGGMGDHGPHQPFFGPDGFLYWTLGNDSGIFSVAAPMSPFRGVQENALALLHLDPRGHANSYRVPGGTFVRKDLDDPGSDWEQVVGGFRNQYDGAFNLIGELFTFDSDMEWDRDLPWFRETRSVHAVPGGDFGWRTGSGKHMDYYIDTLPPMENVGRGSPVGVAFYQSYNYPEEYRDAFLQGDWSRGRIVTGRLTKSGATYVQDSRDNLVYGEPLNVTDVDVGPDGNVYFVLGGRNTQGGVYRVVYTGTAAMERPDADTPLEQALTMPQHRSAYSRRMIREIKSGMGEAAWQEGLTDVVLDTGTTPEARVRALEYLQVFGPKPDETFLAELADDVSWEVRAAATYYLGMASGLEVARRALVMRLGDSEPFVQRRAAEALIRTGVHPGMKAPVSAVDDVFPLLASEDRYVRYAAKELLRRINPNDWRDAALAADGYPEAPLALLAYVQSLHDLSVKEIALLVERQLALLKAEPSDGELLDLIRAMQVTMVNDMGLKFERPRRRRFDAQEEGPYPQIGSILLDRFPTRHDALDREIARVLVHLEPEGTVGKLVAELDNPDNGREQQIHYAFALSALEYGWDETATEQMTSWFERVRDEQWKGGASFVGYLTYILEDFASMQSDSVQAVLRERVPQLTLQFAEGGNPFFGPQYEVWFSDEELEEDLIYNPASFNVEPAEGAAAYDKAFCGTCHTFGPLGRESGPDLTTIANRFSRSDLVRAVIHPSETVSDLWTVQEITKTNGEKISGTIYREDGREVVVQIPGASQVTILRSEIASRRESPLSSMPEGLLHNLSRDEMRALFVFLEAGPDAIPDSLLSPGS